MSSVYFLEKGRGDALTDCATAAATDIFKKSLEQEPYMYRQTLVWMSQVREDDLSAEDYS